MVSDNEERHSSDELEEAADLLNKYQDMKDRVDSFKNGSDDKDSGEEGGSSDNEDPSSSSDDKSDLPKENNPSSDKTDKENKEKEQNNQVEANKGNNSDITNGSEKGSAESGSDKGGEQISKGGESAGKAGNVSSKLPGNKLLSAMQKGRHMSAADVAKKIVKAVLRVARNILTGNTIVTFILVLTLALMPLIILRAMVHEVALQITKGICEIYDAIFDIDGWDEMTDDEKREYCEEKMDKWWGEARNTLRDKLQGDLNLFYSGFQWLDDHTSDSNFMGKFFDSAANWFYKKSTAIDAQKLTEELDELNYSYDNTTITTMLIMDKLRELYSTVDDRINISDLSSEIQGEYDDLIKVYTVVNTEPDDNGYVYAGNKEDAYNQWKWFDNYSPYDVMEWMSVENIPIVIEGEDNFVTMNGEPIGKIVGDKQYLDDAICYNPWGNKRANLSVGKGSDYELLSHTAYIMAMYSATTPYDEQTVDGLLSILNDAIKRSKSSKDKIEGIDEIIEYDWEFSEVYYGAIVPRLYQPYLYIDNGQYVTGKSEYGYFNPLEESSVLGMGPNEEKTGTITVPLGWFDVNNDGLWSELEEFPICLQSLVIPEDGEDVFYADSFCVVTADPNCCNLNATPYSSSNTLQIAEEALGFYIYGTNTEEYSDKVPYANINWADEFQSQYDQQVKLRDSLTKEEQSKYVFRFQFPFTRVSTSYLDDPDNPATSYVYCQRTTPLLGINATESSSAYPAVYNMGYVKTEYQYDAQGRRLIDSETNQPIVVNQTEVNHNGGNFNGYQAWVYLDSQAQKEVSKHIDDTDFSDWKLDNWAKDTLGVPSGDPNKIGEQFTDKPYLYQAKMRYMISINITVIPRYMDYIIEAMGYEPLEEADRDIEVEVIGADGKVKTDNNTGNHRITQGEIATGTYESYMTLLGIKEEEIQGASPQIGSCPKISYKDMMNILRNCRNADTSKPNMNQLEMVYLGCCAAGHVMYQFGGDQEAGINFDEWQRPVSPADHDSKNMMPYEYYGLDCSGFVSWIYKTAFNANFGRFTTESAIDITGGNTTVEVRAGTAKATSILGKVFTDKSKLKVGDIAVRRSYDKNGNLGGHVAMYIGINPDDESQQLWIEMTRYVTNGSIEQVNGIRIFTSDDYGANRNAVYISFHDMFPGKEELWNDISPEYMMIPSQYEMDTETNALEKIAINKKQTEVKDGELAGMVIVLDPGHQAQPNYTQEKIAPWSDETKDKVSAGTKGVSTGRPEYEVVLEISLMMKSYLESKGATVIMTRTTNDVNISNIERSQIAVDANADVFIRLHCDESTNTDKRGIGVFVCSKSELPQKKWGNMLGECLATSTGSSFYGCNSSTAYSGLNWSTNIPSFLLEMGFMSNAEDDKLLSNPEYQMKICQGVADFCLQMKEEN